MAARKTSSIIREGINPKDSFKEEKVRAATAAWELLCFASNDIREEYKRKIMNAKSSNEITRYLQEVRDML